MKHWGFWRCQTCILYAVGLIHVGDKLKEVNGIPVDDKKPEEIIHILVSHICVCDSTLPCVGPVQGFLHHFPYRKGISCLLSQKPPPTHSGFQPLGTLLKCHDYPSQTNGNS